jgi:hypothetical protein
MRIRLPTSYLASVRSPNDSASGVSLMPVFGLPAFGILNYNIHFGIG